MDGRLGVRAEAAIGLGLAVAGGALAVAVIVIAGPEIAAAAAGFVDAILLRAGVAAWLPLPV